MPRRRTLAVALGAAVLVVGSAAGGGWFVFGMDHESPGDCGLGTGGVFLITSEAANGSVDTPADARAVIDRAFDGNHSLLTTRAVNESRYEYHPTDDIDPEFRAAVRQRKFEPDTRLYYFLPTDDPTAFTAYDETLLVTPVGELYGVHVGAC